MQQTYCRSFVLLVEAGLSAARVFFVKCYQNTRWGRAAAQFDLEPSQRVGVRVRCGLGLIRADAQG